MVVERATGRLAGQGHIPLDDAFAILCRHARVNGLRPLCHQVTAGTIDLATIIRAAR